jgi:hypothetical protein
MGIHFPGLKNVSRPTVWVFPELAVCLNCANAEFVIPESELRVLAEEDAECCGMNCAKIPFSGKQLGSTD